MTFNSTEFAIFFTLVLAAYWLLKSKFALQNLLLLTANYIFYGWWNWRFLLILAIISAVSFFGGIFIEKSREEKNRKLILWSCIFLIGSTLAVLKYYNFFVGSVNSTANFFGHEFSLDTVKLFLPIGLSYYVFSTIGYVADVFRQKRPAEPNALNYFAYVSFFPHILSGPIGQSTKLLPQFSQIRTLSLPESQAAGQKILWGLFKKVVVADSLARNVNYIFAHHEDLSGSLLLLGIVMFSFQVYADFSGYSEMAEGFAKLLGFDLMQNFRMPYFSRDVGEFWRKWHRSLSTWLKDYLYVPLGGRGNSKFIYARNILIVFTFSGLWHGASWNFVIWGCLNGLYFLPPIFAGTVKKYDSPLADNRWLPTLSETLQMSATFGLVTFSRIFFRSPDLPTATGYLREMFSPSLFSLPHYDLTCFYWVAVLVVFEWLNRTETPEIKLKNWHLALRFAAYIGIIVAIGFSFGNQNSRDYLYFKF
jgi:alginate O-acetyltransferase complex protein AlgI